MERGMLALQGFMKGRENAVFRKDIDARPERTCQHFQVHLQQTLWKVWQKQEAV